MKRIYQLHMDFDQPVQNFTDLNQLFEELKNNGHIFIYDAAHDRYCQMAEPCGVNCITHPLYIETSVSTEGIFVESEAFWVENYLTGEFYNPEKRPYIEVYP